MKHIVVSVLFILFLVAAYGFGFKNAKNKYEKVNEQTIQGDFRSNFKNLTNAELEDYLKLKDQREKYEKADELLSKMMLLFLADLGLHSKKENFHPLALAKKQSDSQKLKIAGENNTEDSDAKNLKVESVPSKSVGSTAKTIDGTETKPLVFSISKEQAVGGVSALYQAILWRNPDTQGGEKASDKFSFEGWSAYTKNAMYMVISREFRDKIESNHTPQEIINHMYSVFLGRCARAFEMNRHIEDLNRGGPPKIVVDIINKGREKNSDQILAGGFPASSCTH
jgi:hypothetical protein